MAKILHYRSIGQQLYLDNKQKIRYRDLFESVVWDDHIQESAFAELLIILPKGPRLMTRDKCSKQPAVVVTWYNRLSLRWRLMEGIM